MLTPMPQKVNSTPSDAYQMKITLAGSKPPIWRRFVVPDSITVETLHHVVQRVMGWYDCHLHSFEIGGQQYTQPHEDGFELDLQAQDERRFRLRDVVAKVKTKFRYCYDFGDGWEHALLVEKIIPASQNPETFTCLTGKGACPPEDCGGIWGYYRFLKILNSPADPEHTDMKEWIGGKFDPYAFDLAEINRSLAHWRK